MHGSPVMRTNHGRGCLVAAGLCGALITASCALEPRESKSGSTQGAGTNATDDSTMACGLGQAWRTSFQHLFPSGSTADYWGQAGFDAEGRMLFAIAALDPQWTERVVRRCDVARKSVECTSIPVKDAEVFVGAANGRFAVLALDKTTFEKDLVTCTYDGECTRREVPRDSRASLDAVNGTVIVQSSWAQPDGSPASQFMVCPIAGGDCAAPWFQVFDRFNTSDGVVDPLTGNQYLALNSGVEVMECAGSQGTWCGGFANPGNPIDIQGPGQILLDANAVSVLKREIIAPADRLVLVRCLREGRKCARQELALGEGGHQIEAYSAVIDTELDRLLVVTQDFFRDMKPTLYACAIDGSACSEVDISAGAGAQSGHNPRAFYDGARDRMLLVTNGNESRLGLFDVSLCKPDDAPAPDAGTTNDAGSSGGGEDAGGGTEAEEDASAPTPSDDGGGGGKTW